MPGQPAPSPRTFRNVKSRPLRRMPRPPGPSPRCTREPLHPHRSMPRVQGPGVSIKGKRNEASRVWRHSHVTPLCGVKLAQMTTLCQNGSHLRWLCWSQVKAGICSLGRRGVSEHPAASLLPLLAVPMGSSMAHRGPDFSGRVLTAAPCSAGPRHPFTSPWLLALGWSSHHGHWDITDVCPTLVGTDPQEKIF